MLKISPLKFPKTIKPVKKRRAELVTGLESFRNDIKVFQVYTIGTTTAEPLKNRHSEGK